MKKDFNEYRFKELNYRNKSNKYFTMDRVSADETKIVVKVGDSHIIETRFGFALILDEKHVVFLKNWQVDSNYYGTEVLLTKEYFTVKEWGDFSDEFGEDPENLNWETWLETAKLQDNYTDEEGTKLNPVHWTR